MNYGFMWRNILNESSSSGSGNTQIDKLCIKREDSSGQKIASGGWLTGLCLVKQTACFWRTQKQRVKQIYLQRGHTHKGKEKQHWTVGFSFQKISTANTFGWLHVMAAMKGNSQIFNPLVNSNNYSKWFKRKR